LVFVDLCGLFAWKVVVCRRRFSETKKLTAAIPVGGQMQLLIETISDQQLLLKSKNVEYSNLISRTGWSFPFLLFKKEFERRFQTRKF